MNTESQLQPNTGGEGIFNSPEGQAFRRRLQMFPAALNNLKIAMTGERRTLEPGHVADVADHFHPKIHNQPMTADTIALNEYERTLLSLDPTKNKTATPATDLVGAKDAVALHAQDGIKSIEEYLNKVAETV